MDTAKKTQGRKFGNMKRTGPIFDRFTQRPSAHHVANLAGGLSTTLVWIQKFLIGIQNPWQKTQVSGGKGLKSRKGAGPVKIVGRKNWGTLYNLS